MSTLIILSVNNSNTDIHVTSTITIPISHYLNRYHINDTAHLISKTIKHKKKLIHIKITHSGILR